MSCCVELTDVGFSAVAAALQLNATLRTLDFACCLHLGETGLGALAQVRDASTCGASEGRFSVACRLFLRKPPSSPAYLSDLSVPVSSPSDFPIQALVKNKTMVAIDLKGCPVTTRRSDEVRA